MYENRAAVDPVAVALRLLSIRMSASVDLVPVVLAEIGNLDDARRVISALTGLVPILANMPPLDARQWVEKATEVAVVGW